MDLARQVVIIIINIYLLNFYQGKYCCFAPQGAYADIVCNFYAVECAVHVSWPFVNSGESGVDSFCDIAFL